MNVRVLAAVEDSKIEEVPGSNDAEEIRFQTAEEPVNVHSPDPIRMPVRGFMPLILLAVEPERAGIVTLYVTASNTPESRERALLPPVMENASAS